MVDVLSSVLECEGAGRFPAGSSVDASQAHDFGAGSNASWADPERPISVKDAAKTAMERVQAERRAYCQSRAAEQSFPSTSWGADNSGVWFGAPVVSGAVSDITPQQFSFQPPRARPSSATVQRCYGVAGGLGVGHVNDARIHYAEPQRSAETAGLRPRRPASARPSTARSQRYNEIAAKLAERRARTRADLAATRQKISELRSHVMSLMPGSRMHVEKGQPYCSYGASSNPLGDFSAGFHIEAQTGWGDAERVEYVPERLSQGPSVAAAVQPSGGGLAAVRAVSRHRHDIAEQVAAERQAYISSHLKGKLPVSSDGVSTAVGSDVASGGGDWSSCSGPEPADRVDRRRRPTSAKPVLCTGPHVLDRSGGDLLDTDDIGLGWAEDSPCIPLEQSREAARAVLAAEREAFVRQADRTGHADGLLFSGGSGPAPTDASRTVEGAASWAGQFCPVPEMPEMPEMPECTSAGSVAPYQALFSEDGSGVKLMESQLESVLPPLRPPSPGAPGPEVQCPPSASQFTVPFDTGAGVGNLCEASLDVADTAVHVASAQEARKLMAQKLAADREAFICKGLSESGNSASVPAQGRSEGPAAGSTSKLARLAEEREAFLAARKT